MAVVTSTGEDTEKLRFSNVAEGDSRMLQALCVSHEVTYVVALGTSRPPPPPVVLIKEKGHSTQRRAGECQRQLHPQLPNTGKHTNAHRCELEYYLAVTRSELLRPATAWVTLESITLSERSET